MDKLILSLFLWSSVDFVLCQYDGVRGGFQPANQPPANILLHKQALGQDGSFNYAFATDNGLQQGEIINPDGSRKGSYSYVDPNGKTVTLSYSAGKDGFRVLSGDHVPKTPETEQQQRPNQNYYPQAPLLRPNPHYSNHVQQPRHYPIATPIPYEAYRSAPDAPAFRGNPIPYEEAYRSSPHPQPPAGPVRPLSPPQGMVPYRVNPAQLEAAYRQAPPPPQPRLIPHFQPRQYNVQEGNFEKSPDVEPQFQANHRQGRPQKPHSFGDGFAFEFSG